MPEFVDQDETGFVFDELGELTEVIRRLASDPALVQRIGANGQAKVRDHFGLDAVGFAMRSVYDEVLAGVVA